MKNTDIYILQNKANIQRKREEKKKEKKEGKIENSFIFWIKEIQQKIQLVRLSAPKYWTFTTII